MIDYHLQLSGVGKGNHVGFAMHVFLRAVSEIHHVVVAIFILVIHVLVNLIVGAVFLNTDVFKKLAQYSCHFVIPPIKIFFLALGEIVPWFSGKFMPFGLIYVYAFGPGRIRSPKSAWPTRTIVAPSATAAL